MDNYYIEQGNKIIENLQKGITVLNEDLKVKIDNIKDELIKTNDTTAQTHIDNCNLMTNKIQEEFMIKIIDESNIVEKNAQKWQGWFDNLKAIEGDGGYEGAKAKGLFTDTETKEIPELKWFGGILNSTPEDLKPTKKTITTYYWTSYSSVTIDSNGYISININFYTKVDNGAATSSGGFTATVASDADYATYYTNRSSVDK